MSEPIATLADHYAEALRARRELEAALADRDATIARVRALHPRRDNVTHGCCAPPKLCTGHPPVCDGKDHHWSDRPTWPCPTIRALDGGAS